MERFEDSPLAQEMTQFHCPRMNEFPDLELYMDQVLTILQNVLSPFLRIAEKSSSHPPWSIIM